MSEKSIIIIGAGLAGLSAGCYARMNGYRTHIFEHHTVPGGVCTAWKRQGYTIDGCIHWLMSSRPGSEMHRVYEEVGALDGNRVRILKEFQHFRDEAGGKSLAITADLDRLAAEMKAVSPPDEKIIDDLVKCCRDLQGIDTGTPKPKELAGPLDGVKMLWSMRRMLKYVFRYNISVAEYARRFQDPFLRWGVTNMFVPEMPVYLLFIILGQLADGQLGYVEGGSQKFSDAIARRYQHLGGEITYGAQVEEILVEDNRAVGIRLADGSAHRADAVISAADGYSTIFRLLGGRYVDQGIRDRYANWPLFSPLLMISFGTARQFPGEPAAGLIRLQEPLKVGGQETEGLMVRIFNYDASLAPAGKTVVQVYLETEFDYWNDLQQDRARYEAEKQRVAADVLDRLERHYPGITAQVEMTDVATPFTLWRYTRNHRAAFEGWLMTKETVLTQVPKTLPGLSNFYMAGQWVEPGGGIPPALYSGRNAVQIICKQDGKPFAGPGKGD